jgi:hypothetical protein
MAGLAEKLLEQRERVRNIAARHAAQPLGRFRCRLEIGVGRPLDLRNR